MSANGIIGPYFVENANGDNITVNSQVYRVQIIDRFVADLHTFCELKGLNFDDQIFQQDGATCHTGKGNLEYLQEHFHGRLISRFAYHTYPPRSPDLTPCDAFLWGFMKENCFRDPVPASIDELKSNVERVVDSISDESLVFMIDNIQQRMEICLEKGGEHMEHVILRKLGR